MVGLNLWMNGHELSVISTLATGLYLTNRSLPKGWVKSIIHREPVIALSLFWAISGLTIPVVVPPIRRALGLPTNQYDPHHPNVVYDKYYD
jgi:hypothetical protein